MSGVYISCGSFDGDDKSGSPLHAVLGDLTKGAGAAEVAAITRIQRLLDGEGDQAIITTQEAKLLLPLVHRYRADIAERIAPITDPQDQIERDFEEDPTLDPTDAQYGKSLGWKYYCVLDLARALAVSAEESEAVVISWD